MYRWSVLFFFFGQALISPLKCTPPYKDLCQFRSERKKWNDQDYYYQIIKHFSVLQSIISTSRTMYWLWFVWHDYLRIRDRPGLFSLAIFYYLVTNKKSQILCFGVWKDVAQIGFLWGYFCWIYLKPMPQLGHTSCYYQF